MKKNEGQALITAIIFFLFISTTITLGVAKPVLHQLSISNDLVRSKNSYFLSESLSEDITYRLKTGKQVSGSESLILGGETATASVSDILGGKSIVATGNFSDSVRKVRTDLIMGSGASFSYGVQVGDGGLNISNSATVEGNVFSNGPITGQNSNLIKGDVISAGPTGLIDGVQATSSAYAHTIRDSQIDKDAHYQIISSTTVGGVLYPNSPDQAVSPLPISDALIADWETAAAAGGTVTCSGGNYNISGSVTLGPKKIPCNLSIDGSDRLYLTGPLWVTGNIQFSNTSKVAVDESLSGRTVAIIADNPSNQTSSSKISASNSAEFQGAGANSYILLISQNKSAEQGGGTSAIDVSNSVFGKVLVYAGHGKIAISNTVNLKEVTAYRIEINNSAKVIYETGLANLLFTTGPSGGYTIDEWRETQ
ncbi:MAG: hypothetical protein UX06_C0023G0003 [Candidatus Giovannonibacteria bacterium GW2011_GWA2_45_21]|uniref:Uncharacterized protein n=1 Tax=Candidatus Giovannonibacteria bacterium GW2011_GWA2_45_21 TaxID=1618649 RepID=A0A0G1PFT3_9BACT|nr:MAG: hypothetical protein UX06_C0023G0003 [Candidatus Giovannonibacteria bacterium GW2011_GWA2_45_21]